jgi:hypothetical protein
VGGLVMTVWCLFRIHHNDNVKAPFNELIGIYQTEEEAYAEKTFYDSMNLNYSHYIEERYI